MRTSLKINELKKDDMLIAHTPKQNEIIFLKVQHLEKDKKNKKIEYQCQRVTKQPNGTFDFSVYNWIKVPKELAEEWRQNFLDWEAGEKLKASANEGWDEWEEA